MSEDIKSMTPGAREAFEALDIADRIIERSCGTDVAEEWHAAYHKVAEARRRTSSTTLDREAVALIVDLGARLGRGEIIGGTPYAVKCWQAIGDLERATTGGEGHG